MGFHHIVVAVFSLTTVRIATSDTVTELINFF